MKGMGHAAGEISIQCLIDKCAVCPMPGCACWCHPARAELGDAAGETVIR